MTTFSDQERLRNHSQHTQPTATPEESQKNTKSMASVGVDLNSGYVKQPYINARGMKIKRIKTCSNKKLGGAQLEECLLSMYKALGLAQHHINKHGSWPVPLSPELKRGNRKIKKSRSSSSMYMSIRSVWGT